MPKVDLPTFPAFRELRIQDRERLQRSFDRLPPETSDQNFTSLFMWRHNYNIQISQLNGCICLHCAPVEGEFFFPPVGQAGVLEAAETCLAFLDEQGKAPLLGRVPERTVKRHFADRARFSISEDRDSFDYVYTTEHLVTLSGRSYHGQRNHIRTPHALYQIQYHIVWVPKRRRDVMVGDVAAKVQSVLVEVAEQYDLEIGQMEVQESYVRVEVSAPPKYAPAEIVHWLKEISARETFAAFPQVKENLWAGELWADGYYVSTSGNGLSLQTIEQYAQYQPHQRLLEPLAQQS